VTEHLARHQLEHLLAGDPHSRVHPALRVHLTACDQCSTRKRALDAARTHFLAEQDGGEFARSVLEQAAQVEPAPRRRFMGWSSARLLTLLVALLALGGAGLFWFERTQAPSASAAAAGPSAPAQSAPPGGAAAERATLQVLVKHEGQSRAVQDGDALTAGDRLTFEYALDKTQHLLLLAIDDTGMVTRYFPGDPTVAAPRPATVHEVLPIAVDLDQRKGEERIYAFFYDPDIDETTVRRAMVAAQSAAAEHGGISAMRDIDGVAARQVTVWYRKQ
jgi:hypothetical protein